MFETFNQSTPAAVCILRASILEAKAFRSSTPVMIIHPCSRASHTDQPLLPATHAHGFAYEYNCAELYLLWGFVIQRPLGFDAQS